MGNLQTLINYHSPLSYIQDLNEQIQDCGMVNHPGLGPIQLWKIKQSNSPMMFSYVNYLYHKNQHVHLYKNDSHLFDFHRSRCQMKHPNLLAYFACTTSMAQNIGNVQSLQLFFAYYDKNLKQKLLQYETVPEIEIWNIVEQIVSALAYLQGLNRFHGNLTTESILINEKDQIKILDQLEQKPNGQQIKKDVFDLGLVIMEMLTGRANQLNFFDSLKPLAGIYSIQLLQLVGKMLQRDALHRPDFIQLQEIIKNRFKEPIILHNPCQNQSEPAFVQIINCAQRLQSRNQEQRVITQPGGQFQPSTHPRISKNSSQSNLQNITVPLHPINGTQQNHSIVSYYQYFSPVKQLSRVDKLSTPDRLTSYQSGIQQTSAVWQI
ncbi:unnamed protein product (macronuclear) [Paramecium tetraurelia]|uniref:Protein kinase domain-containing protein n=1 Tax=Paramecium tetraurelia TaxID=5888 RepID=A0E6M6_PARTE|nr:uncharacterized protein GSPATT00003808001 [Paramecium tetraurelia]CAK90943.1 unnamed protein product [Paramecium tetraurelia]|eukprot:XP_001458340.1 hypothetical protein (macronuclear) [Paramecium tetraurelia strain d4-2]